MATHILSLSHTHTHTYRRDIDQWSVCVLSQGSWSMVSCPLCPWKMHLWALLLWISWRWMLFFGWVSDTVTATLGIFTLRKRNTYNVTHIHTHWPNWVLSAVNKAQASNVSSLSLYSPWCHKLLWQLKQILHSHESNCCTFVLHMFLWFIHQKEFFWGTFAELQWNLSNHLKCFKTPVSIRALMAEAAMVF